jgi:hypothetical protein
MVQNRSRRRNDSVIQYTLRCLKISDVYAYESGFEDLETFEKLARGYKVDGRRFAEP